MKKVIIEFQAREGPRQASHWVLWMGTPWGRSVNSRCDEGHDYKIYGAPGELEVVNARCLMTLEEGGQSEN
jgi:hypothetical protein